MGHYEVQVEFHKPMDVETEVVAYHVITTCTEDAEHVARLRAEKEYPGAIVRVLSVRQAD